MIQIVTQYAGYGLFAQIALALFFFAFMLILVSTLIRPKSLMQHYARMALSDDVGSGDPIDATADPATQANDEHGAAHHE